MFLAPHHTDLLHVHIESMFDGSNSFFVLPYDMLLICFRCFKREFTEGVALRMWEACWANFLTDYFHLFLCLSIICVYADDVIAQDLKADEMLLHFSSLGIITYTFRLYFKL